MRKYIIVEIVVRSLCFEFTPNLIYFLASFILFEYIKSFFFVVVVYYFIILLPVVFSCAVALRFY